MYRNYFTGELLTYLRHCITVTIMAAPSKAERTDTITRVRAQPIGPINIPAETKYSFKQNLILSVINE